MRKHSHVKSKHIYFLLHYLQEYCKIWNIAYVQRHFRHLLFKCIEILLYSNNWNHCSMSLLLIQKKNHAQVHVCSDSIYFGQPSVIVYIVNIIVNDTKIIIFQQCFLSFLCKSGRKTDKAKLCIPSTINTGYLLWQSTV